MAIKPHTTLGVEMENKCSECPVIAFELEWYRQYIDKLRGSIDDATKCMEQDKLRDFMVDTFGGVIACFEGMIAEIEFRFRRPDQEDLN